LVFNFIIGNGDAHLKNWSLIYPDRRRAQLSPAYDLVSTAPYYDSRNPDNIGLKLASNKRFERVSYRDLDRLQTRLNAVDLSFRDVVADVFARFEQAWGPVHLEHLDPAVHQWISVNVGAMRSRLLP
jgi:serine/threonine-protein kinase HipA